MPRVQVSAVALVAASWCLLSIAAAAPQPAESAAAASAASAQVAGAVNSSACREKGFTGLSARSLFCPLLSMTPCLQRTCHALRATSLLPLSPMHSLRQTAPRAARKQSAPSSATRVQRWFSTRTMCVCSLKSTLLSAARRRRSSAICLFKCAPFFIPRSLVL